jgi:hypothetical protein
VYALHCVIQRIDRIAAPQIFLAAVRAIEIPKEF